VNLFIFASGFVEAGADAYVHAEMKKKEKKKEYSSTLSSRERKWW